VLVTLGGLVISAGVAVFALRARSRAVALCLAAACGGALGNLADRLLRAPGFGRGPVVDWIHLAGGGGSFNVADTAIQFGAIGAVIAILVADRVPKRQRPAGEQPGEG
jgi:signal peptidase II